MTLTNQFKLSGDIIEGRLNVYPQYIKALFHIKIDDFTPVTLSYFVSRKYNQDGYNKMNRLISNCKTAMPSWVYIDKEKYYKINGNFGRLFAMGNLSTNGKKTFFNADYIEFSLENLKNFIDIRLAGQWVDENSFLTIQHDEPLLFNIKRNNADSGIVLCKMEYRSPYNIDEDIILDSDGGLSWASFERTDKHIENVDMFLLEWEIISENN